MESAGAKSMGAFATIIPMISAVYPDLKECFKNGGGLPYSKYSMFHRTMASTSDARNNTTLISQFIPSVPGLLPKSIFCVFVFVVCCSVERFFF
jgi:hypothetical protein